MEYNEICISYDLFKDLVHHVYMKYVHSNTFITQKFLPKIYIVIFFAVI